MTVVCGMIDDKDAIWMTADSCISIGNFKTPVPNSKIKQIGNMLFGMSGEVRFIQVILNNFKPKDRPKYVFDDFEYVQKHLVRELKSCYEKYSSENPVGQILLGYNRNLYTIDSNWAALKISDRYYSIGSGSYVAIGALTAYAAGKVYTGEKVKSFLEASTEISAKYISNVSLPLNTVCMEYEPLIHKTWIEKVKDKFRRE